MSGWPLPAPDFLAGGFFTALFDVHGLEHIGANALEIRSQCALRRGRATKKMPGRGVGNRDKIRQSIDKTPGPPIAVCHIYFARLAHCQLPIFCSHIHKLDMTTVKIK
jgi:hypothetical protein